MDFSETFIERFRWIGGHADVLGLLADGAFLAQAAKALAAPFRARGVTKVAGIEARGFILGTAVALDLAVGFVPIRKRGSIRAQRRSFEQHPTGAATSRSLYSNGLPSRR
jgi:adenine/guanine phosphoribosyltransferase-like PRPP-binding protein